jgi:ferric-dicitrate binding protein FerR (iron transport regulator)
VNSVVRTESKPPVLEEDLAEQAAEWLLELESSDPKVHVRFADWVRQSPQHVGAFLKASAIDALASELDPQKRIPIEVPAAVSSPWRAAVAACLCIVAIAVVVFFVVR